MNKIKVKVFVEKAESGYSAYMDDSPLDYGCIGEGVTVEAAIEDFCAAYEEMKAYYATKGMPFTEAEFEFYYDTASFLAEYAGIFSLAGLEKTYRCQSSTTRSLSAWQTQAEQKDYR